MKKILSALALSALAISALAAAENPNILIFVTDDQRWDTVSVNNPEVALSTPNIDRLAEEGINFHNGFVTTPICAVSRASILSGKYSRNNDIHEFLIPMSEPVFKASYPALLKEAGYYLGQLGKYGVGATDEQIATFDVFHADVDQGPAFNTYRGKKVHDSEWLTLETRDFLASVPADQPFCLQVNYKAPHPSSKVAPEDEGKLAHHTFERVPTQRPEYFAPLPPSVKSALGALVFHDTIRPEKNYQRYRREVLEKIASVDRSIGRIRQELQQRGLDDNTVILFISDHGTHFGEKQLGGKWTPYEQSLRVPFFLYDPRPGALKAARLPQIALNIDIAPTVLHLAGLTPPEEMDGLSLVPLARGEATAWRDHFFYEHQTSPVGVPRPVARFMGVRSLTENYVRWTDEHPISEELYHLEADPWEVNNLANDPLWASKLQYWSERFDQWQTENPDTYPKHYNPYGPRPQTNAPGIDWKKYKKYWPDQYKQIAAEVERLGVTWEQALEDPNIRQQIGKKLRWYY